MSIIVALVLCWGEHMCFHPFLSLSPFFLCSDTPDKGISDGFDQIWLPREITHLAWSSNAMILLLQSKHKHGIHGEGTKMGDGFIRHLFPPPEVWVGSEMKAAVTAIGFVALLLGCFVAELISEENTRSLSLLQCSPLFSCQHPNVNHFLNSFQVIKTLPDRVCSMNEFSFNCLASVSRMGCGHPLRPEAFLIGDHMGRRMRLLPCLPIAPSGTSHRNCLTEIRAIFIVFIYDLSQVYLSLSCFLVLLSVL